MIGIQVSYYFPQIFGPWYPKLSHYFIEIQKKNVWPCVYTDDELESGEEVGTSEGDLTQEVTEEEDQDDEETHGEPQQNNTEEPRGEPQQNNTEEPPHERVIIKADIHITDSTGNLGGYYMEG